MTPARLAELEIEISRYLGFEQVLDSVGQVYPRSLDFDVVSALVQLAAAPSSLAKTIRLMAGNELVTEGFKAGQVGSSAMPHKMNTRSCERVNGFAVILRGYASMVGELAGDQWNEGDVSCSVVRRVALADSFFAIDGLFETFLTVLDEFGAFPAVVERELERYLPFLSTTKVLMASVRAGVGRETAHEVIKEHAVAVALEMREKGVDRNDLLARLASDERLASRASTLEQLVAEPLTFTGAATARWRPSSLRVAAIARRVPGGRVLSDPETSCDGVADGRMCQRRPSCRASRPSTRARSATSTSTPTVRCSSSRATACRPTTGCCRRRSPTRAASSPR